MPNLTPTPGLRFSLPGTGNTTTPPNAPERKPSGSRIRDFMKSGSIRRRPGSKDEKEGLHGKKDHSPNNSKDGVFQFGANHSNVEFKVELDAGSEAQAPVIEPVAPQLFDDGNAHDNHPYPLLGNRSLTGVNTPNYVPLLIEKIANNLSVIQGLHQRSLREGDVILGSSRTNPVDHELHYYGTRTRSLCVQLSQYFQTLRGLSGPQQGQAQQAKAVLKQYQNILSDFLGSVRLQMEDRYRQVRPEATDQDIHDALKDLPSRNVSVSVLRIDDRENIQPLIRAIERRSRTVSQAEESLRELDNLYSAIVTAEMGRRLSDAGVPPAVLSSRECIIAPQGDVIMMFKSGTYFQVSSQTLSAVSPLFSYALYLYKPGDRLHQRGPPPADLIGGLPTLPPEIVDPTRPMVVRMPQDENDERSALSTLLYAAHTRHDKVPRHIEFEDFVAIASVCHKYRCTAPIEIFVECFWLPQWKDKVCQSDYEHFIFISYVFGLERIFELTSKKVIIRSREEKGLFEGCDLPQNVWRRMNHARGSHFRKIVEKCNATINLYLPHARSSMPGGGRTPRDSLSIPQPPDLETSIQLVRPTRCPQGSHACDAANLGYLMMVMNEVGVLPPAWSNFAKRSDESLSTWQGYSLHETLTKLCGAPSAPNVHDGCDYAPAFRNAMCDIFNGIRGLSVRDVNERYANRRNSQLIGVGGPAADEGHRRTGTRPQSREVELGPHSPGPLAVPVEDTRSSGSSNSNGAPTPNSSSFQAYWDRTLPSTVLEDERPPEAHHRHTLAILNERNLATIDGENGSIVSTEVDTRTDRCVSPSVDSVARTSTPVPANTSVPSGRNGSATTSPSNGSAPPPVMHDAREADKIFWTQHAHKERITIADKQLLISNKHIMRIGEERGLPPLRPNGVQAPDGPSSPPPAVESTTPTLVESTTPTQETTPVPAVPSPPVPVVPSPPGGAVGGETNWI